MRVFWILAIALLLAGHVSAQSPLDHSRILEFPAIYIYPYYWVLPIEDSGINPVQESDSPQEDVCGDALDTNKSPVFAF